jgi:DNA-binding NtrC family response regulator
MDKEASLNILIVDDDRSGAKLLRLGIQSEVFSVDCVFSGKEAVSTVFLKSVDCVLLDLQMPDMNGMEVLSKIKAEKPFCPVIITTGQNEVQMAVTAIKQGAYDYLIKPLDLENVRNVIHRAVEQTLFLKREAAHKVSRRLKEQDQIIFAPDSPLVPLLQLTKKIAPSDASILLSGESGTGKELFARMIHQQSLRAAQSFIEVNCGAIPAELLESEFFGHEKGAFTGAHERREGLFTIADKGTLFLDEIAELQMPMQVKLLRTLQSGEVRRVGSNQMFHVNVRIIAATSKNLENEIKSNTFREDLYYRLNVVKLVIPPLRQRRMDIPKLIAHFLKVLCVSASASHKFNSEAERLMQEYSWPGNVRELRNTVERLMLMSEKETITRKEVEADFNARQNTTAQKNFGEVTLEELEYSHIQETLKNCQGNKTHAAQKLGITLQTLYNKLNAFKKREDHPNTI